MNTQIIAIANQKLLWQGCRKNRQETENRKEQQNLVQSRKAVCQQTLHCLFVAFRQSGTGRQWQMETNTLPCQERRKQRQ